MQINLTAANSPYFLDLSNQFTQQLPLQDVKIDCDTTAGAIIIALPRTSSLPFANVRILVTDTGNSASLNNITIITQSGEKINGVGSYVINTNEGFARIQIGAPAIYTATSNMVSGGSGSNYVPITYDSLKTLADTNGLSPGTFYLITDYQTATYIQYSGNGEGGIGGEEVNVGPVEQLVVQAISPGELAPTASSLSFPKDIIFYSVNMADRDYDYAEAQGKGCITKRIDTENNITRDYDWRNVVFRRWQVDADDTLYISYTPTAFSFQDFLGFANCESVSNVSIGSLTNASLRAIANTQYWLDNTIFVNQGIILNVNLKNAYVNMFASPIVDPEKFNAVANLQVNTLCSYNLFATYKNIGYYVLDNIIASMQNNKLVYPLLSATPFNFSFNKVNTVIENTGAIRISSNQLARIAGNETEAGEISGNSGVSIEGNVDFKEIIANFTDLISQNNYAFINQNYVTKIQQNVGLNDTSSLSENYCNEISDNENQRLIKGNVCNAILRNTSGGVIENNIVTDYINDNLPAVTGISNNFAYQIDSNDNVGNINNNRVQLIKSNTNSGDIDNNGGESIAANTNNGSIENNNVSAIGSNSVDGLIGGNSVASIQKSEGSGAIKGWTSGKLNTCILAGDLNECQGALENCIIGASINRHNFIDSIINKKITPTAEMTNPAIPTKSMYNSLDTFHYTVGADNSGLSIIVILEDVITN